MTKEKKISIKYYYQKHVFKGRCDGKQGFKLYTRITYNRISTRFTSGFYVFTDNIDNLKEDLINRDNSFLESIIRYEIENHKSNLYLGMSDFQKGYSVIGIKDRLNLYGNTLSTSLISILSIGLLINSASKSNSAESIVLQTRIDELKTPKEILPFLRDLNTIIENTNFNEFLLVSILASLKLVCFDYSLVLEANKKDNIIVHSKGITFGEWLLNDNQIQQKAVDFFNGKTYKEIEVKLFEEEVIRLEELINVQVSNVKIIGIINNLIPHIWQKGIQGNIYKAEE